MSAVTAPAGAKWGMPDLIPAAALLGIAITIGPSLGSLARPLFVLGCIAVSWYSWRKSPAAHFRNVLLLFAFAPFARRLVDVSAGFDGASLMLVGPLLAILVPGMELLRGNVRMSKAVAPAVVVVLCVIYATLLTILHGGWSDAASGALKWLAPIIYAATLATLADRDELLEAATSAFAIILPLTGAYAIYQYIDPPEWDRFWMQYATILSAGQPVPYGVRSFSTLNGPASYATFTATGLLLIFICRFRLLPILLASPALIGLMLSQYRTAWIALAAGVLFCLLFRRTSLRAIFMIGAVVALGLLALTISPFSEVITERLATLGQGSNDGSAQERLQQYVTLWALPDSSVIGSGFSTVDVGTAGSMAVDGMIIACWQAMGIPVGILCLFSFVWAICAAVAPTARTDTIGAVAVGAFAIGALFQLPLAILGSGELGFLFWSLILLTPRRDETPPALKRSTPGKV
ncbi:O-antigen ligase family protein [Tianweitania sediminis]|uniref:O-antigen ligase family protein n=1 Tax=Tianweitania sediminis TaxID=1502156 RepID=A0A8J7R355_9HYPH|nr:O-antigen ligase family protein [Tianweitania sediminis]MBP0439621.1 O-antigen ligase family protein [Tianweitania sediminis]